MTFGRTTRRATCALVAAGLALAAEAGPTIAGCAVFPRDNYWNTRVDNLPLHPSSSAWVGSIGSAAKLHADWGNILADNYGIPFITVPGTQPLVPITYDPEGWPEESDPGPYPVPPNAPIEGGPAASGDRHVLVVETTNCRLYELYVAYPISGGASWSVYSSAKYDFASNALRPDRYTSADAAGLAILPGLVRYEEVEAGEIAHAIRFTAQNIWGLDSSTGLRKYLWPARHWSGSGTNPNNAPMGARFRLKASFDISSFHPHTQVILRAFKKYGLVLADAGSNWFFQGVSDTRWSNTVFSQLASISGSNFEAVDAELLRLNVNSGAALQLHAPATNLDGDAKSDLLYRNSSTGQVYRMLMNGFAITGAGFAYHEPDTAWSIVADADFTGEGVNDLLWRSAATGGVYLQPFGYNGLPSGGAFVYTEPNQAWKIAHTPDLNGDGKADLLWWNSNTGQVYAMLMNGTTVGAQGFVYSEPNTNWRIVAVGDFAGTGRKNQLLWRNSATGQVYLMTVTFSGGVFSQTGAMIYQEPNTAWKILAAADFNGDGKSDILWRNDATGQVYMLLMNGGAVVGQALIYTEPNLAWKIVAQGDYNGDGKADLLWRNDGTGQVYMMLMNGVTITSAQMIYQEANTAWKLLGSAEYSQ